MCVCPPQSAAASAGKGGKRGPTPTDERDLEEESWLLDELPADAIFCGVGALTPASPAPAAASKTWRMDEGGFCVYSSEGEATLPECLPLVETLVAPEPGVYALQVSSAVHSALLPFQDILCRVHVLDEGAPTPGKSRR